MKFILDSARKFNAVAQLLRKFKKEPFRKSNVLLQCRGIVCSHCPLSYAYTSIRCSDRRYNWYKILKKQEWYTPLLEEYPDIFRELEEFADGHQI